MDEAASSSEQTARTVFWIIVASAAGFVALVWVFLR